MIRRLKLKNYLSHKFTTLDFVSGVNIIVGETDAGKSAIMSSFRWLKDNRPLGDSYRSNWGGDTKVSLYTDTNCIIHKKTDNEHSYYVDKLKLTAFKSDVPEEVSNVLLLDDINLQLQFDSHFLLRDSPGDVARHFNKLAHLDEIDISLRNINSEITGINGQIKAGEKQKKLLEEQLQELDIIEEAEKDLVKLEKQEEYIQFLEDKSIVLDNLLNKFPELDQKIEILEDKLKPLQDIEALIGLYITYEGTSAKAYDLRMLLQNLDAVEEQIDKNEIFLDCTEGTFSEIMSIDEKISVLRGKLQTLNELLDQIENLENKKEDILSLVEHMEEEIHLYFEDGELCPLCNTYITHKSKNK